MTKLTDQMIHNYLREDLDTGPTISAIEMIQDAALMQWFR